MIIAALMALVILSDQQTLGGLTPAGWVRHGPPGAMLGAGSYTFAAPPSVRGGATKGIDSYPADYKGPDLSLSMDFGQYGGPPCDNGAQCTMVPVTGGQGTRSSFAPDRDHLGSTGIRYYFPIDQTAKTGATSLVVWAYCSTVAACELVDRMMTTVTLLPVDDRPVVRSR
jgi:hypothetical protein